MRPWGLCKLAADAFGKDDRKRAGGPRPLMSAARTLGTQVSQAVHGFLPAGWKAPDPPEAGRSRGRRPSGARKQDMRWADESTVSWWLTSRGTRGSRTGQCLLFKTLSCKHMTSRRAAQWARAPCWRRRRAAGAQADAHAAATAGPAGAAAVLRGAPGGPVPLIRDDYSILRPLVPAGLKDVAQLQLRASSAAALDSLPPAASSAAAPPLWAFARVQMARQKTSAAAHAARPMRPRAQPQQAQLRVQHLCLPGTVRRMRCWV